jgi:lipopolysaccharide/colanic/teichoic acid biosynthesis glycosyltransferase
MKQKEGPDVIESPTTRASHTHTVTPSAGEERLVIESDRVARRALDIVLAAAALLVLSPLLALIVLAVVLESRGPIIYRAERVGHHGRPLRLLKFRKMAPGASGLPLTVDGDSRLTATGRFLARSRLDELPQLWQVLTGELSLVGPRPEDPVFVQARSRDYAVILGVRPGLTGFSQLAFADECRILAGSDPVADYLDRLLPQKCALDRLYVQRASLATNLRVLMWTIVPVVLRRPVSVDRATGTIRRRRRPADRRRTGMLALSPSRARRRPTRPRDAAAPRSYARTAGASRFGRRSDPSRAERSSDRGTR